jgi:hypothetical protein
MNNRQAAVLETLREFGEAVRTDYLWVNNGGCGVYALYLIERLRQAGIKARAVVSSRYGQGPTGSPVRALNGGDFSHVLVYAQLDGKRLLADSEDAHLCEKLPARDWSCDGVVFRRVVGQYFLKRVLKDRSNWNDMCDREELREAMDRYSYILDRLREAA